jgi:hypothetical protein
MIWGSQTIFEISITNGSRSQTIFKNLGYKWFEISITNGLGSQTILRSRLQMFRDRKPVFETNGLGSQTRI